MVRSSSGGAPSSRAEGAIPAERIAEIAAGRVTDHRFEGEEEAVLDGAFALDDRPSGLTVHATDATPRRDFSTVFTAPPGFSVTVLLQGFVEADFDGESIAMGDESAPHAPSAHLRALTRSALVRRRARGGVRVRKVSVDVSWDWLDRCVAADGAPSAATLGFLRRHLATAQWTPSPAAIHAAERLMPSRGRGVADSLDRDRCALTIVQEALGMLEDAIADPLAEADNAVFGALSGPVRSAVRAAAARALIDRRAAEPLGLSAIASAAGMSVSALQRAFKAAYGVTVIEYRTRKRLDIARAALAEDGATVEEAARIAGYAAPANFSTAFRRVFGAPPSAFRR